jgi:uncharacterized protein YbcC (UPF0753/DUF2309 family)
MIHSSTHETAVLAALDRIPPLWPLDHFVAVNPFIGLTSHTLAEAAAMLRASHGVTPFQSPSEYLKAWKDGSISSADLEQAADMKWTTAQLIEMLENAVRLPHRAPITTVADLFDRKNVQAHWIRFITDEISKWCSVAFDENQTTWNSPWKSQGLFTGWHLAARHDRSPEAYELHGFRAFVAALPADADQAIGLCLSILNPHEVPLVDFLHRQLATISGWAGFARYIAREDEMRGKANPILRDLLAIRLAYDAALLTSVSRESSLRVAWEKLPARDAKDELTEGLSRWQDAYENAYRNQLALQVAAQPSVMPSTRPPVQAMFCIDVRSEPLRRHLEAALVGAQTIGFAGFFGFPVAHRTPDSLGKETSRCPVLLVPPIKSKLSLTAAAEAQAHIHRAEAGAWKAFQNSAASCFSFVEAAGLAFGAILGRAKKHSANCCDASPILDGVSEETRANLAEGALRGMGLTTNFARLVLICGHGSHSENNPYASSLDCGACGGHPGDLNARLAAATLNDPAIRAILADREIRIPADTIFLGALHNTLCDDVTVFNPADLPATHAADIATLTAALTKAGYSSRLERAPSLGLADITGEKLTTLIRDRASDISQVRPEWGLAGNAAIVAAPRSRTAALKLDSRVFLQDYNSATDPDDKVLTAVLTAPVVVGSWINLQYYASSISPDFFGSGDKTIHHVVGGIGVMEGNQGDLKTGLPIQSIHDGKHFVHEPRRLTAIIEATRSRIDAVLAANSSVLELTDHGWMHLIALEGNKSYRRQGGVWREIASSLGKDHGAASSSTQTSQAHALVV